MKKQAYLLLLLFNLITTLAVAQAPQSFSYQAIARDKDGNPVADKAISVEFNIHKGSSSGTVVYKESLKKTTNAFGLFSAQIGSSNQSDFSKIKWGDATYYLETKIDLNGGSNFDMNETVQLISVPYAFFANAANAVNESQKLQLNNNQLSITNADGTTALNTVTLPTGPGGVTTYAGSSGIAVNNTTNVITANPLIIVGNKLSIQGQSSTVDLSPYLDNTDAQTLTIIGNQLSISGGNTVPLPPSNPTAVLRDATLAGNGTTVPLSIAQQNATIGQVLKWNGSTWIPSNDSLGTANLQTYTGANGITVSGSTISITPGTLPTSLPPNGAAGGDLTGPYPNPSIQTSAVTNAKLAANAVTTDKITDGTIQAADLNQMNATDGQILKWSQTQNRWLPQADNTTNPNMGDNWGTQTVIANTTLSGNGTTATPLSIADGGVTTIKLADQNVTTTKIANNAVDATKLASMGATTNGQVLKWNGTAWAPGADLTSTGGTTVIVTAPISGDGSAATPLSISDGSIAASKLAAGIIPTSLPPNGAAGGDLTGPYPNPTIQTGVVTNTKLAANAVTTDKIADGTILGTDLNQMSAASGQVLKWNGTAWAAAIDETNTLGTTVNATSPISGNGSAASPLSINDGTIAASKLAAGTIPTSLPPSGAASGDLTGTYPNPTIQPNAVTTAKIAAKAVDATKLANMGATTSGQVLKWNGTTWAAGIDSTSGTSNGDNWGTQTTLTNATLTGNGTTSSPLSIAQQNAANGQVLKWDGTAWVPASDDGGTTYTAGAGISLTGTTITNTGDNDNSTTNELQTLSLSGSNLTLSNGGGTVTLPTSPTYTAGAGISITGTTITNTGDNDNSSTNELQTLSLSGSNLTLSNGGGTVPLPTSPAYTGGTGISISGSTIINTSPSKWTNTASGINYSGDVIEVGPLGASSIRLGKLQGLWRGAGEVFQASIPASNTTSGEAAINGQSNNPSLHWAALFSGPVRVNGTLSKSSGSFLIDHPQDPENKYLYHSFVESPDMMNIYNGNITTDANGEAVVALPTYFEAENIDFKYQLTVIGQFAQAIIGEKVKNNQFKIRTDKPNVEVSWQVTGVRNDKWAQQNRIVAEVEKEAENKGKYLNPETFGQPIEKGIMHVKPVKHDLSKPRMPEGYSPKTDNK